MRDPPAACGAPVARSLDEAVAALVAALCTREGPRGAERVAAEVPPRTARERAEFLSAGARWRPDGERPAEEAREPLDVSLSLYRRLDMARVHQGISFYPDPGARAAFLSAEVRTARERAEFLSAGARWRPTRAGEVLFEQDRLRTPDTPDDWAAWLAQLEETFAANKEAEVRESLDSRADGTRVLPEPRAACLEERGDWLRAVETKLLIMAHERTQKELDAARRGGWREEGVD